MTDAGSGPLVPVPAARGRHAAVAAPQYIATAAGLHVLQNDAQGSPFAEAGQRVNLCDTPRRR